MVAVYRNTTNLSFDGFIRDLHVAFEMSPQGIDLVWSTSPNNPSAKNSKVPPHKCLVHKGTDIHQIQLRPGDHLEDLTAQFLTQVEQRLRWEVMQDMRFASPNVSMGDVTLSLYDWCADVLINSATQSFFGPSLLQVTPDLVRDFYAFDDDSWMLIYRYPRFLARNLYSAKNKITEAFTRYFQLPPNERPGACYHVCTQEANQREAGLSDRDIAIIFQMFYWV